jgi:hypothetical protein
MKISLGAVVLEAALIVFLFVQGAQAQAHEHINAGAESLSQDSMLIFDGAEDFLAQFGYVWETAWQPDGYFPGYYAVDGLTFTALPATIFYGGPEGKHAAVGTNPSLRSCRSRARQAARSAIGKATLPPQTYGAL